MVPILPYLYRYLNKLTIEECFDYIESLSKCAELWGHIKNPKSSDLDQKLVEYIERINFFSINRPRYYRGAYLINYSYLNVFLLACFHSCNSNSLLLLRFLKSLEKYLFAIEFYNTEALDEAGVKTIDFSKAVIKLNNGNMVIDRVIEKSDKLYNFLITSDDLLQRTISYYNHNGFYHTSWLRYFLCEYEFSLMKKSKCNIVKLDRWIYYEKGYNSIEHILPENSHY